MANLEIVHKEDSIYKFLECAKDFCEKYLFD